MLSCKRTHKSPQKWFKRGNQNHDCFRKGVNHLAIPNHFILADYNTFFSSFATPSTSLSLCSPNFSNKLLPSAIFPLSSLIRRGVSEVLFAWPLPSKLLGTYQLRLIHLKRVQVYLPMNYWKNMNYWDRKFGSAILNTVIFTYSRSLSTCNPFSSSGAVSLSQLQRSCLSS